MMFNRTIVFITFISCCLVIQGAFAQSECTCTISTSNFQDANSSIKTFPYRDQAQYNFHGFFGNLIQFKSLTLFEKTVHTSLFNGDIGTLSGINSLDIITKEDLDMIIQNKNEYPLLFGPDFLNLKSGILYFTSTRVEKSQNEFFALKKYGKKYKIIKSTLNTNYKKNQGIFKIDPKKFQFDFDGYSGEDLEIGGKLNIKIETDNVMNWLIELDNGQSFKSNVFEYIHSPREGKHCTNVSIRAELSVGAIVENCFTIYTKTIQQKGIQKDSTLAADSILSKNLLVAFQSNKQSNPKRAPIAPINDENSSFLIFYSQKQDGMLYVQKINSVGETQGTKVSIEHSGQPLDITTSFFEFFVLAVNHELNTLWIESYNIKNGKKNWSQTIIKQGVFNFENKIIDSDFLDPQCSYNSGFLQNISLLDGRLNYAKDRLQVVFMHSTSNEQGKGIMCQAIMHFKAENGLAVKVSQNWEKESPLVQPFIYSGGYLHFGYIQVSLFHFHPESNQRRFDNNDKIIEVLDRDVVIETHPQLIYQRHYIRLSKCPIEGDSLCSNYSFTIRKTIVDQFKVEPNGRVGEIFEIQGIQGDKFFVYENIDQPSNQITDVTLVRFSYDKYIIFTKIIYQGHEAYNIQSVNAVPYGKNILLQISKVLDAEVTEDINPQQKNHKITQSYLELLNSRGERISGPFKVSLEFSASENWKMLENGAIASSHVNQQTGQVSVRLLPGLMADSQLPSQENKISHVDCKENKEESIKQVHRRQKTKNLVLRREK